ncbi:ANTAR domain-containing protein [Paenibacillus rhizovicinus]|uniref:ANTAR domain-containing protein n=2 Tax=Paenibacillus rhizovicinus TaxID=2704463 RepID=A0A6C0P9Q0_9BACL|nr:ANTAR domain-containing protein [Paenibacillus rhizovicinus]
MRRLPTLWLCPDGAAPTDSDWGLALDGVLFGSMNSPEMNVALQWGLRNFQQRKRWAEEREQLTQRIEERKWIDQAKAVLCEIKGITEAEAYDFLRKQAMNERKRIGDVSASIVKVYQLIHG